MKKLTEIEITELKKSPDKYDWNTISRQYKLTPDFIEEFADKLNWDMISKIIKQFY